MTTMALLLLRLRRQRTRRTCSPGQPRFQLLSSISDVLMSAALSGAEVIRSQHWFQRIKSTAVSVISTRTGKSLTDRQCSTSSCTRASSCSRKRRAWPGSRCATTASPRATACRARDTGRGHRTTKREFLRLRDDDEDHVAKTRDACASQSALRGDDGRLGPGELSRGAVRDLAVPAARAGRVVARPTRMRHGQLVRRMQAPFKQESIVM
jgi:hypothetical protein